VWACRFGTDIMDIRVGWTKNLCSSRDLPSCSVLDIGTGSGRLLQQLAKQGYAKEMLSFIFCIVNASTDLSIYNIQVF
jgi:methylase of polypeptide subunit release factors